MGLALRFSTLALLSALVLPSAAFSQGQPQLLADLNTNLTSFSCSTTVNRGITSAAVSLGRSFFSCTSPETGSEIWVSDGTQVGTKLVKEIYPGATSSSPLLFTPTNGGLTPLVFFIANSPEFGVELWRSDGTPEGTSLVADIAPGISSSIPRILGTFADQAVIFSAEDGTTGRELYYADRTSFRSLGDLYPGPIGSVSISASGVYLPTNGKFYYAAAEPTNGLELFQTDSISVSLASNIRPASSSSQPANFTLSPLGTAVYFSANNGTSGVELWSTNGTVTAQVADINPGTSGSNPSNFVTTQPAATADRRLVFSATTSTAGDRLYFLNPSSGGVGAVAQVVPGATGDNITTVISSGNNIYFQAVSLSFGKELFSYNVLTGATNLVSDFTPGVESSVLSEFAPIGDGSLLVKAYNPNQSDEEYYVTNGGANSLTLLRDVNPGPLGSAVVFLGGASSYKIFQALSGNDTNLWRTDGTFGGTFAFKDLSVAGGSKASNPFYKFLLGNRILHDASTSVAGSEPQAFDLSVNANEVLRDIAPGNSQGSFPGPFIAYGNRAIFSAISYSVGYEPFITDGTPGGTQLLGDFCSDQNLVSGPYVLVVNDKIVVVSPDASSTFGYNIFVSNTGPESFTKITGTGGLYPSLSSSATQPVALGNYVFFSGGDAASGAELQRLDLSNNTITMLADFYNADQSGSPGSMTVIDNRVFFAATVATPVGRELGVTDGTIGGTFLVGEVEPSPGVSGSPQDFIKLGSSVVFSGITVAGGRELYKTNGSPGNLELIKDINPTGSGISVLADRTVVVGGILYFSGSDGVNGFELWRTDGTAVGTYMVKDINPGAFSSTPNYMLEIDGYIYFAANHVDYGLELWRSDGTEAGTVLMRDFAPGLLSGNPLRPLVVGGTLVLGITDGFTGNELYRWTVDECLGSPKFAPGVCGCGAADVDVNSNGIFDCKQGAELKVLLDAVAANLRTLSNKRLKVNKRKAAIRSLRSNAATAIAYGTAGAGGISVSSSTPLPNLLANFNKRVRVLAKKFSTKALSEAKKAFKRLNVAIVA